MYIITTCKTRCVRLCLFRVYTHWFFLSYNNTIVYDDCRNIIVGKNLKQIEFARWIVESQINHLKIRINT